MILTIISLIPIYDIVVHFTFSLWRGALHRRELQRGQAAGRHVSLYGSGGRGCQVCLQRKHFNFSRSHLLAGACTS